MGKGRERGGGRRDGEEGEELGGGRGRGIREWEGEMWEVGVGGGRKGEKRGGGGEGEEGRTRGGGVSSGISVHQGLILGDRWMGARGEGTGRL